MGVAQRLSVVDAGAVQIEYGDGRVLTFAVPLPGSKPTTEAVVAVKCAHSPDHIMCELDGGDVAAILNILTAVSRRK